MRWVRARLEDASKPNSEMFIDLIVDQDSHIKSGKPYCGWWGKLVSTEMVPFVCRQQNGDYYLDFGSATEDDQDERLYEFHIDHIPIRVGSTISVESYDDRYELTVTDLFDLIDDKRMASAQD